MRQTSFICNSTNNRDRPVIRVAGERLGVIGAHQLCSNCVLRNEECVFEENLGKRKVPSKRYQ
jgi:hypothetical protein